MRVVLDTNVVISALVFKRGSLAWFRAHWRDPKITPLASRATVKELIRVLSYPKFQLDRQEIEALLTDYLPCIEVVDVAESAESPECADPDDQMFVDLAIQGEADALVTGDAALLAMSSTLPVLSPAQYRDQHHHSG
jgi:putative PIN family toxin of toxin-antitoxin system